MDKLDVLIIDDDEDFCQTLRDELHLPQVKISYCCTIQEALPIILQKLPLALVVDLILPDGNGMEILKQVKEESLFCEVIILTGNATIHNAIEAMKAGAYDFLLKPSRLEELELVILRAIEKAKLKQQASGMRYELSRALPHGDLLVADRKMKDILAFAEEIAAKDSTILIQGETGVGKEVLARFIHNRSRRRHEVFVVIDCTLLERELLHSEIFGHEKGAFTGALQRKQGLVELAHGGTLFVDEIGELDLGLQAKFLRFLEINQFRRLGGLQNLEVNVRTIIATNQNLTEMVKKGTLREDLYYRLNVIPILIPPLRERPDDIPVLAAFFANSFGKEGLSEKAIKKLIQYHWPGNVRELKNIIERAAILAKSHVLQAEDIMVSNSSLPISASPLQLEDLEKITISKALKICSGHRQKAATLLGIGERTLYRKMKKFHLEET